MYSKDIQSLLDQVKEANKSLEIITLSSAYDKKADKHRLRIRARSKDISFEKYTHPLSKQGLKAALKICQDIETDYYRGCFDASLVKYGLAKQKIEQPIEALKEHTLLDIWETYKALKPDVPASTFKNRWIPIDRWLNECPKEYLLLSNGDKFFAWLRNKYADGYIHTPLCTIRTAVNLSIKLGKVSITNNPFSTLLSMLEIDDKNIQIYSKEEAKTITKAFRDGKYDTAKSAYSSKFYAGYVEFRIRTGCRPSEAIALTWDDIEGNKITFNKRYSTGQLLQGTKNGVDARIFPCNKQMIDFLDKLPKIPNDNNLVFPSYENKYIDSGNFHARYWCPIVKKLFEDNIISKQLTFYDLRHSFITWLVRDGVDIKTIATIVGNSPETIMKHYLANNEEIELPEI
jgi:integrase